MVHDAVFEDIPVLDIGDRVGPEPTRQILAERFTTTCHRVGFAVVTNHGVAPSLTAEVFDMMARFFALPEASKKLIDKQRSPQFRGWEPVGAESTNNRTDVREQIDVWSEWPSFSGGGPDYLNLLGPNQWMPDDVLPGHRQLSQQWMSTLSDLADELLALLSLGLGLGPTALTDSFGEQPMSLAKFIHYPPTPSDQAGVNAHHDTGFLTVLAPGPTSGLQVQNQVGAWIDVPPVPDGLVINLGEMLQAMTGNYLAATPHRVITSEERLSTAYFKGPSLPTPLTPLTLAPRFAETVAASPYHRTVGFMATKGQTEHGVGDMQNSTPASTYGEQLWNYFSRSYPGQMAAHHGGGALALDRASLQ